MERYRVNYWLLGTLFIGAILLGGAVYGIWNLQMTRNAGNFRADADEALEKGDLVEAAAALSRYLALDQNNKDAMIQLATVRVKLADEAVENRRYTDYGKYMQGIENTLSRFDDANELRRDVVDLYFKTGQMPEALNHIKALRDLEGSKDDLDLQKKEALCLLRMQKDREAVEAHAKLLGFNATSGEFEATKGPAADDPDIYLRLAAVLLTRQEQFDAARKVIDKAVENNPNNALAYLSRGQFMPLLAGAARTEKASEELRELGKADINKAYELDADDPQVALAYIQLLWEDAVKKQQEIAEIEKAGESNPEQIDAKQVDKLKAELEALLTQTNSLAEQAIKQHPENAAFYQYTARVASLRKDAAAAMAELDKGIKAVDEMAAAGLQIFKIEMLLNQQDTKGAAALLEEVRKQQIAMRPDFKNRLDVYEGRIKLAENKWFQAREILDKARGAMPSSSPEQRRELAGVDFFLGFASERLGARDLAKQAYLRCLQNDPENMMAKYGLQRIDPQNVEMQTEETKFSALVDAEGKKPEADRDWDALIAKLDETAKTEGWSVTQVAILKADILTRQNKFDEARTIITELARQNGKDLNVWRVATQLVALDPKRGPAEAMKILDKAVAAVGDLPILRIDRARLIARVGGDDVQKQILAQTENMDEWDDAQKVQLWSGVGQMMLMLRDREAAEKCFTEVTKLAPDDLQTRVVLFRLALEQSDDDAMAAAQEQILSVTKSKSGPTWMYTEAARRLSRYQRKLEEESTLDEVKSLLDRVVAERPEWSDAYLLLGDLALVKQDAQTAIENFAKALELGAANPVAVLTYVNLLTRDGRFFEARKALDSFDPAVRQQMLGRVYAEILFRTNSPLEAASSAAMVAEGNPEDAAAQLWYGQFMQRLAAVQMLDKDQAKSEEQRKEFIAKAGAALKKVVELVPTSPEGWLGYITFLRATDDLPAAEQAIREAQLSMTEDEQSQVLARAFELVGRWFDAENLYQSALEANPEDSRLMRLLAEFYMGPVYPKDDKEQKAVEYLNKLLKLAADKKVPDTDPHVQWARRRAANVLAASGDYQQLLQAEKMLASNAVEGQLGLEDRLEMARILAPRPEPVSRQKAIALLEEVRQYQDLTLETEIALARLYFVTGNWPKTRDLMTSIIARYPDVPAVRDTYIRMLLQRGGATELSIATQQLNRLSELAPNTQATLELVALVASKTGNEDKAQAALQRLVPPDLSKVAPEAYPLLARIAQLLSELKDDATAQRIYEEMARVKSDDPRYTLQLAAFLGTHGEPDKAFEMIESLKTTLPMEGLVQTGTEIVRLKRDEVGDKYNAKIASWIDTQLRDDPGSIALAMQRAEFYDLETKYEEAAKMYRDILANPDLEGRARAIVLNNLAYLLILGAAEEATPGEAAKLVDEAVQIIGPSSEILDTRAVLRIQQGDFANAVADLELAVTDSPTASKFMHKAQAHLGAKANRLAIESWDEAERLGLKREDVSRLELDAYDKLAADIEKLKRQSGDL